MEKYFSVNENGMSVKCKIYTEDMRAVKTAVLYAHGFGGHKDNRAASRLYSRLIKRNKGAALITFDLPCHGEDSSPKLRLSVCDSYITAVIEYIRSRFKPEKLFGCANSFGGYLYLKYIRDHGDPFDKVALRCPALTIYDSLKTKIISKGELEAIEKGKSALVGFDRKVKVTAEFLNDLEEADILSWDYSAYARDISILHGTKDEIIDFMTDWEFADKNGIDFYPYEGADHRFTDPVKMDLAINQIIECFGLK